MHGKAYSNTKYTWLARLKAGILCAGRENMSAWMWISAVALPIVLGALAAYIVPRLQALVQRHVEDRDEDKDL